MFNGPALDRRAFLAAAAAGLTSLRADQVGAEAFRAPGERRPKIAIIVTEMKFSDHGFVILENFFRPYLFRGELTDPGVDVAAMYCEQFPDGECAREASRALGVPLFDSIAGALGVGGKQIAVDAVLAIGEHGDYPEDEIGCVMYPRKRFFDEAVAVMRHDDRIVPYFNDKHLSYRWDWAREMYDTARRLRMPLGAGSSVPWAARHPSLALDDAEIEEAVAVHGGPLERYGIHGLEVLQSFVERRRGGETGIRRVETLTGDRLRRAEQDGRWSAELLRAAMDAERAMAPRRHGPPQVTPSEPFPIEHAILVEYRDGLRGAVLAVGLESRRWNFACRAREDKAPRATAIDCGPWGNRNLFKALAHLIQRQFIEGREQFPPERALLTTGAHRAVMESNHAGCPIETPHLKIAYQAAQDDGLREDGASWRKLTADVPPYSEFIPGDEHWLRRD